MFHFHALANSQVAMLANCHEKITSSTANTLLTDTRLDFSCGIISRIGAEQPPLGGTLTAGAKCSEA
jgi:hypothetical protein